ncbi:hypothetical protein FOA52_004088, partial [Chlamydomonas sp. UWO 241]
SFSAGTYVHPAPQQQRVDESPTAATGGGRLGDAGGLTLLKSFENCDVDPNAPALTDGNSELGFDVFKIPSHMVPAFEESSLPVKVTAHSRASVVSNIITKLVSERGSAVLITAGGRAMHVAMMAAVAARARLRASRQPQEVLLLPKFVTVDTTGTLGWESVFLKFHIVRAPCVLLSPGNSQSPVATAAAAAAFAVQQQQQQYGEHVHMQMQQQHQQQFAEQLQMQMQQGQQHQQQQYGEQYGEQHAQMQQGQQAQQRQQGHGQQQQYAEQLQMQMQGQHQQHQQQQGRQPQRSESDVAHKLRSLAL